MNRRSFIEMTIAAPVGAVVPALSHAQIKLGTATLTTVSDGHLTLPGEFIFVSMPKQELMPLLDMYDLSAESIRPECNLALYRDGTNTVLFDTGAGPDFMPSAGKVIDSLASLDLVPDDITHVLLTHAHPDHIWGLLDEFDDPLFFNATYMMGRSEWDYWWNPETVDTIGEARASFAVGAKRRMEVIEDAVIFFDDGDEVLPGIQAVSSPGHTPGHMCFELRYGTAAALIVGDAIGNHHVAFHRPDWLSGADQDAEQAVATRLRLFDRIKADDLQIVGFHLPQGGVGRVEPADTGYRFVPEGL